MFTLAVFCAADLPPARRAEPDRELFWWPGKLHLPGLISDGAESSDAFSIRHHLISGEAFRTDSVRPDISMGRFATVLWRARMHANSVIESDTNL